MDQGIDCEVRPACPFANSVAAARKLLEIAKALEPVQDGRIYIEAVNGRMLFKERATPAEYKAGLDRVIAKMAASVAHSGEKRPRDRGDQSQKSHDSEDDKETLYPIHCNPSGSPLGSALKIIDGNRATATFG